MTVTGIFDRTFRLYFGAFREFLALAALALLPWLILRALFGTASTAEEEQGMFQLFVAEPLYLPIWLLTVVTQLWFSGAAIVLAIERVEGRRMPLRVAFQWGIALFPKIIVANLFVLLCLLPSIAVVSLLLFFRLALTSMTGGSATFVVLMVMVGMPAIAYGLYLVLTYLLVDQAIVVDGKKGRESLARSAELMKANAQAGFFGSNLGLGMVMILFLGFVGWGITAAEGLVAGLLQLSDGPIRGVLRFGAQAFANPISAIAWTLFFLDVRRRKEHFAKNIDA